MKRRKNWLEWLAFAMGVVSVSWVLGYLVYREIFEQRRPPRIVVTAGAAEAQGREFVVPLEVVNHGTQSAESVRIAVVLRSAEGTAMEQTDAEIAYLPGGSTRHAAVVFDMDPAKASSLEARTLGYEIP